MADADLLDQLVRPDNLVDYQIQKEVKFNNEHKKRLDGIEAAVNPSVAPVADAPGDPVLLTAQAPDPVDIVNIARTVDAGFNKIVTVFAALCEEVAFLKQTAESKFYAQLSLFGHTKLDDGDELSDGLLEAMLGRALPMFQDAHNFVSRVQAVVLNAVRQVQALYHRDHGFAAGFREVRWKPVAMALGDALLILVTLDTIIRSNRVITAAWEKYKRVADIMRTDPAKYGADPAAAAAFDKLLTQLDAGLITGNTFQRCLDQQFEPLPDPTGAYRDHFRDRAFDNLDALATVMGTEAETTEAKQVAGQFALYALYRALTAGKVPPDALKKQFERLWKLCEKVPLVPLYSKCVWLPDAFLMSYCSVPGLSMSKLVPKDPNALRAAAADALADGLQPFVNVLHTRTLAWLVRADMAFAADPMLPRSTPPQDLLRSRIVLLNQAIFLSYGGHKRLQMLVNYQLALGKDFKRRLIDPLVRLVEVLKVLEASVRRYHAAIVEALPHIYRDTLMEVLLVLRQLGLKAGSKKADDAYKYIAAATELVQTLVFSTETWSPVRRVCLDIGLAVLQQKSGVTAPAEVAAFGRAQAQLALLSEYHSHMRTACDTSILYWVRELMPAMVAHVATPAGGSACDSDARSGTRLQYLFTAFSDSARMVCNAVHLPPPPPARQRVVAPSKGEASGGGAGSGSGSGSATEEALGSVEHLLTAYERYLHGILQHDIIMPLCRAVENDLRFTVHAVHLSHMEAPSARTGRPPLVHLLHTPPIRIVGTLVDIRQEVTHYLEKTFYELTTIALHDWKTYGEMASVAADKYGLALTDNHLPMGCLDQGLDVLQIMRNIHVFVARYNYNLNQQFFVEKKSVKGAKHLNTVSITSVSGSIRQHGSGMMNTTVNFAYQFLAQKFNMFSQFLYDEYIKSYLAKERRYYRRSRKELDNRYPYDHAVALNREIRSLGLTADKQSFLDKFRSLVSEIGNTLGYVRMVRSAGMHAASEAVSFVPDLSEIISFEEAAKRVGETAAAAAAAEAEANGLPPPAGPAPGLSAETIEAARRLDDVLKNLTDSFAEGADYFKLLVSVFQHVLLAPGGAGAAASVGGGGSSGGGSESKGDGGGKKEEKEGHLRNFFLIVPALTVNFTDNMRNAKDRMEKSVKGTESFFSDDGFPIGLAYILAILKQDRVFDSIHWWDSVAKFHKSEIAAYRAERATLNPRVKADADRIEELNFKARRIEQQQLEFDQLYYAFSGARTFFKVAQEAEEEEVTLGV